MELTYLRYPSAFVVPVASTVATRSSATYLGGADAVSTARVINYRGDVGGTTYPVAAASRYEQTRAFHWRDGRLTILDALPEPRGVTVVGIDGRGRLAGTVAGPADSRAVVWDVGTADGAPV